MQLLEHIKEMWGQSLSGLAKRLKMSHSTLSGYNYFQREMPLWRVIQLIYETGISWDKVGELLENDYTKSKVRKLAASDDAKNFEAVMSGKTKEVKEEET